MRLSARHDPPSAVASAAGPGLCLVVVHGFTGSWRLTDQRAVATRLTRHAAVVSVDLRGHGGSGGLSTVGRDEPLDVDAAVTWARSLGYSRVVTLGWSMGAAVVLRQAASAGDGELRPSAVIAVSGPSRWNYRGTPAMRMVQRGIGTRLGRLVLAKGYGTRLSAEGWPAYPDPPDRAAARLRGRPVLVVHGDEDHYFPVDHARWLAAAAQAELWIEPGMRHAEGAAAPELLDRLGRWAADVSR